MRNCRGKINFPPVVRSSNKYNLLKQLQCWTKKKIFLSSKLLKEIFHLTPLKFFRKKNTHRLFAIHFVQKKEESTYKSYVPETFNKFSNFQKKNFLNFHTNKFSSFLCENSHDLFLIQPRILWSWKETFT